MTRSDITARFTFFLPDARVLDDSEVAALPTDKIQAVDTDKKPGVWLEIHCPDAACIKDDGRISIPAEGIEPLEKKGIWLNLFCPEGSCKLEESTELP
jgi:hypothetical protein